MGTVGYGMSWRYKLHCSGDPLRNWGPCVSLEQWNLQLSGQAVACYSTLRTVTQWWQERRGTQHGTGNAASQVVCHERHLNCLLLLKLHGFVCVADSEKVLKNYGILIRIAVQPIFFYFCKVQKSRYFIYNVYSQLLNTCNEDLHDRLGSCAWCL